MLPFSCQVGITTLLKNFKLIRIRVCQSRSSTWLRREHTREVRLNLRLKKLFEDLFAIRFGDVHNFILVQNEVSKSI